MTLLNLYVNYCNVLHRAALENHLETATHSGCSDTGNYGHTTSHLCSIITPYSLLISFQVQLNVLAIRVLFFLGGAVG